MLIHRAAFARALVLVTVLASATAPSALAAWPFESHSGVPLCLASGEQTLPQTVSDGAGGAIVVWTDARSGGADIYAQRVSREGNPLWAPNGIAVCSFSGAQTLPSVIADGVGGAIVAWQDARGANLDVYAQRVAANGTLLWPTIGAPVCVLGSDQHDAAITTDGAGGAIIAWVDGRAGFLLEDIYAQRLNAAGAAQWTPNGNVICAAGSFQFEPRIVSDDAGGAIVTWTDWRSEANIYAQRVNGLGATAWAVNGVPVCVATSLQNGPVSTADGTGGALIAWLDYRTSGTTSTDIYIQRLNSAGSPLWTVDGVAACAALGAQLNPTIAADGVGGVDIVWEDQFNPAPDSRIHWDHLGPSGYTTLPTLGCGFEAASGERPVLARTGSTPIIAYLPYGTSERDAHTMRLVPGNFERASGVACDAPGDQIELSLTADDNRGVIVAWRDQRSGASDIYVHRVDNYGFPGITEPVITNIRDVVHDQGGRIKVSWLAGYFEQISMGALSDYRVWRAIPPDYVAEKGRSLAGIADMDAAEALRLEPGRTILQERTAEEIVYWEFVGSVPVSGNPGYSYLVPTLGDSVAGWNPLTRVRVQLFGSAAVGLGYLFWNSVVGFGYSVDNLAPAQPTAFAGQFGGSTTALTWNANGESDLANYRLYRGSSPSFVPSVANRIAMPTQPHFTDSANLPYVYKLTAVDVHGNESPHATLILNGATDAPEDASAFFFAPPAPNPSSPGDGTQFRFRLPEAAAVRLAIFDLAGRRVRAIAGGVMSAGEHQLAWDRRDGAGRSVAAGVYIVRLEANDREAMRRVVLIE